jgi:hypothetical protein
VTPIAGIRLKGVAFAPCGNRGGRQYGNVLALVSAQSAFS